MTSTPVNTPSHLHLHLGFLAGTLIQRHLECNHNLTFLNHPHYKQLAVMLARFRAKADYTIQEKLLSNNNDEQCFLIISQIVSIKWFPEKGYKKLLFIYLLFLCLSNRSRARLTAYCCFQSLCQHFAKLFWLQFHI